MIRSIIEGHCLAHLRWTVPKRNCKRYPIVRNTGRVSLLASDERNGRDRKTGAASLDRRSATRGIVPIAASEQCGSGIGPSTYPSPPKCGT